MARNVDQRPSPRRRSSAWNLFHNSQATCLTLKATFPTNFLSSPAPSRRSEKAAPPRQNLHRNGGSQSVFRSPCSKAVPIRSVDAETSRCHSAQPDSDGEEEYESEEDDANPYPLEGKFIDESDRHKYGAEFVYILSLVPP